MISNSINKCKRQGSEKMQRLFVFILLFAILLPVYGKGKKTVEVKIVRVSDLPAIKPDGRKWDGFGYADPMVTILVDGRVLASTSFKKDHAGSSVVFNETFKMYVNPRETRLGFKVFDKDVMQNDLMGEYQFSDEDLPLRNGNKTLKFYNGIVLDIEIRILN